MPRSTIYGPLMTTMQLTTENSVDLEGTIRVQLDREPIQRYTRLLIDNYPTGVLTAFMPEDDSGSGLTASGVSSALY